MHHPTCERTVPAPRAARGGFAISVLVALLAMCWSYQLVKADVIRLKSGGEIRGVVRSDSNKRPRIAAAAKSEPPVAADVLIETLIGTEIAIVSDDVAFVTKRPRIVEEYESQASDVPDTPEARWQLAEWCRQHGLTEPRKEQLRLILELDPEHKQAHYGLGHRRQDGRWVSPDESDAELLAAGYVRYKGRVITSQERDLLEAGSAHHQQQNEWRPRIRLWLGWLTGRDVRRQAEAVVQFRELRDTNAIPALADFLLSDKRLEVRQVAVQALAQMDGPEPVPPLARVALSDADIDLQNTAFDSIDAEQRSVSIPIFEQALKDESNAVVRRAALLLGRVGVRSTVPALIEALATIHPVRIAVPHSNTVGFNRTVNSSGQASPLPPEIEQMLRNGQLPYGVVVNPSGPEPAKKWVTIRRSLQNQEARESLRKLTEQDFGFDKRAWKLWWQALSKG